MCPSSRKACSLCPSWGPGSCVGQRWPWSSPREWACWRSRGEVSTNTTWILSPFPFLPALSPTCVSLKRMRMKAVWTCGALPPYLLCGIFDQTALPGPSSSLPRSILLLLLWCAVRPERQWEKLDPCREWPPASVLHRCGSNRRVHPHVRGGSDRRLLLHAGQVGRGSFTSFTEQKPTEINITCAMSHFSPEEQCGHHGHFGAGDSRRRYWHTSDPTLSVVWHTCVCSTYTRPQTWKIPWSCSFPHVTRHVIPSLFEALMALLRVCITQRRV